MAARMRFGTLLTLLLALAALACGCGYQLSTGGGTLALPGDVKTVALARIDNPTTDTGLPAMLASRFRDEITNRNKLAWADKAQAEGLVYLTIKRFNVSSALTDAEGNTIKFSADITMSARIVRRRDDQTVWQSDKITVTESFFSGSQNDATARAVELAARRIVDRMGQAY